MELPQAFIRSIENAPGINLAAFEAIHQSGTQVTSIRFNPAKKIDSSNHFEEISTLPIPWSAEGYYLSQRPSFTADPIFHAGGYYVQEASSMFLEQVLKQTADVTKPLKVLDLCAAPGGKTTLLQSLISEESLLVSNEVIKTRVTVLAENVTKWGAANVIVTNNDAKDFQRLPNYFDVIVIDAPCSGSGLFRRDPNAVKEWSEQSVEFCSQRQQRIVADVLPALKEDGILIYSTCSYSKPEDEDIADWLIDSFDLESVPVTVDDSWNIITSRSGKNNAWSYRFYPDKLQGEGFFIAAFRKTVSSAGSIPSARQKAEKISQKDIEILQQFIENTGRFSFLKQHEDLLALPEQVAKELPILQSALYIKKAGVNAGTIIRNELVPDHCLAMSTITNPAVASVEVSKENALQYLRKQSFDPGTALKGWALITYLQLPLGWVKLLPNRLNNYYPKDWRILNK